MLPVPDDLGLLGGSDVERCGAALDLLGVRAGRVGEGFAQLLEGEKLDRFLGSSRGE